jgi:ABC-type transporter MlaC component
MFETRIALGGHSMTRTLTLAVVAITLCASSAAFAQTDPVKTLREACSADFAKLCPNAQSRDDRRQCMTQNADKFSDTCKAAVAAMRAKMSSGGGQ